MLANVTKEFTFRVADRAMSANPDAPVRPQKFKSIAGDGIAGFALAVQWVLISGSLRPRLLVSQRS